MSIMKKSHEYLRMDKLPLFWCPGCTDGIVLGSIARSLAELNLKKEKVVVVTGIGCWGKADDYIATHTVHVTHGRAVSFATGIKSADPELKVLVLMGDGDCATIGGNHFIHAARRNIDLTAVVVNNFNYGMTGGQYSATTPEGSLTSTSTQGTVEPAFDLCQLAIASGATYVARTSPYHVLPMQKMLTRAIDKKGFSFLDIVSTCPTHYGRRNKIGGPAEMMAWLRDHGVSLEKYEKMTAEEREDIFPVGVFEDRDQLDHSTKYRAQWAKA